MWTCHFVSWGCGGGWCGVRGAARVVFLCYVLINSWVVNPLMVKNRFHESSITLPVQNTGAERDTPHGITQSLTSQGPATQRVLWHPRGY